VLEQKGRSGPEDLGKQKKKPLRREKSYMALRRRDMEALVAEMNHCGLERRMT
jgi:hypothetical protein